MAAIAVQASWREQDGEVMEDLVKKYHCFLHSCPNRNGWCFVRQERHNAMLQTQFKSWTEAIVRGDNDVDFDTPPADMKFVPVDAG